MKGFIVWACMSILTLFSIKGWAQQDSALHIIHQVEGDKVFLRWAPGSPGSWLQMNENGVEIAAIQINPSSDTGGWPDFELIEARHLPWTADRFRAESVVDTVDEYTSVLGQLLHSAYGSVRMGQDVPAALTQSDELMTRYSMAMLAADLSREAAISAGMRVEYPIDTAVRVLFRLILLGDGENTVNDTSYVLVDPKISADEPPVPLLDLASEGDHTITLSWDRIYHQSHFSAFYLERSGDGGVHFQKITSRPYLSSPAEENEEIDYIYIDSVQENYHRFVYRLIGITPFAQLSAPSPGVTAMARDLSPPPRPLLTPLTFTDEGPLLVWSLNPVPTDFGGFQIEKSSAPDRGYLIVDTIYSSSRNQYIDRTYDPVFRHYRITAFDTSGNQASSLSQYVFTVDSIPPSAPAWSSGTIDSNGITTLHWHPGSEEDLKGYKLYYAYQPDHVFTVITDVPYFDTIIRFPMDLKNLSEDVYFKLVALDQSYNHSQFSEILHVKKPDRIPPDAPIFKDYDVGENEITLHWALSHSKDVSRHLLYRRDEASKEFAVVLEFSNMEFTSLVDNNLKAGTAYEYVIRAVDDDGNYSQDPDTLVLKTLSGRKLIQLVPWQVEQTDLGISISWSKAPSEHYLYRVYRQVGDFTLRRIGTTTSAHFLDNPDLLEAGNYTYRYLVIDEDGRLSEFSQPIQITVVKE